MKNVLKITTLALALVMVLGMAMAFAAPSITATVSNPTNATGTNTKDSWGAATALDTTTAAEKATAAGQTETASNLAIVYYAELDSANAGTALDFPVSGVADGTLFYAYHWDTATAAWQYVNKAASSGNKVTFTFPELSPVAIVQTATATPQTGDNSNIALWGGLMVAAIAVAAGTVVYSRKRKNEA